MIQAPLPQPSPPLYPTSAVIQGSSPPFVVTLRIFAALVQVRGHSPASGGLWDPSRFPSLASLLGCEDGAWSSGRHLGP